MLIAPAGYGKTTLAEQWVARDGRVGIWYTARSASTDVAALALGIARAATALIDDSDHRLREHLRALPAPAENVQTLAEILSEDLAAWPNNAWLVLDDYHEITPEPKAEDFVDALVALSSVPFLIASRVRPRWVASKRVLYGDILELTQAALAMDSDEAANVLAERSPSSAAGLRALAQGWPAVIGLASASSAEVGPDLDQVPDSLYRFFAEEVFESLGDEVQRGLTTISVAPVLDRELVRLLLGSDAAEPLILSASDLGVMVERDSQLVLHPLARAFLEEQGGELRRASVEATVQTCLAYYESRRDWDAAFDLIVRERRAQELHRVVTEALDEMLASARLSTIERWLEFAVDADLKAPIFSLARAELLLRGGRHIEAIAHASEAAATLGDHVYRALTLSGRSAHLASREDEAIAFYRRASEAAQTETERQDSHWGELGCLIDLEDPSAEAALDRLGGGISLEHPRELVRCAAHRLYLQMRAGSLALEEADTAHAVLSAVPDPLVVSSFLSGYSVALALSGRYREALDASRALGDVVSRYRMSFALPYALCGLAMAHSGLRAWSEAESCAGEALELGLGSRDTHVEHLANSLLLRILAQQGRVQEALDLRVGEPHGGLRTSRSEVLCSKALVLACIERFEEALDLIARAKSLTRAVETVVLVSAVDAICALRAGKHDAVQLVGVLAETALSTGAVDLLVAAYRACPELLPVLTRGPRAHAVEDLIVRVDDADLSEAAGHPIASGWDRTSLLSPRELEVYELLCGGLTNRQIAKTLFIEESTARVHTHHVFDKLGVRSRQALAVQALLRRSDQSTATADSVSSE
jgi:DNA-binding NarL/FixJ family response regulator